MSMRDFLARYERGEHGVWDELVAGRPREEIHINERIAFEGVTGSWHEAAERLRTRLPRDLLAF